MPFGTKCSNCGGRGHVYVRPGHTVPCAYCGGSGYIKGFSGTYNSETVYGFSENGADWETFERMWERVGAELRRKRTGPIYQNITPCPISSKQNRLGFVFLAEDQSIIIIVPAIRGQLGWYAKGRAVSGVFISDVEYPIAYAFNEHNEPMTLDPRQKEILHAPLS